MQSSTIAKLPEGYSVCRTNKEHWKGVTEVLQVLTTVGSVTEEAFKNVVEHWDAAKLGSVPMYNPVVILDDTREVVASGMVFIEQKVIHGCGLVGHIEDIAVRQDQQGKRLGQILIWRLCEIAKEHGCYKVILDCDAKNVVFYEKCGLLEAGIEMQVRFDK